MTAAEEHREELAGFFAETLDLRDAEEAEEAAYGVTPGWSSVAHMELVTRIEDHFSILLETDDIIAMDSFGRAVEILRAHGVDVV